jgi:phosphoribosylanthranilate isomerase
MILDMHQVRVKICCIASVAEAQLAIRHGAMAVGLVSAMPSGPGVIDEQTIARIAAAVPSDVATFLLTSKVDPQEIIDQQRRTGVSTLQLVDRIELCGYATLRRALPDTALVQVIHVNNADAVKEATTVAPHVDAILLDSGNQKLAIKQLGGTGRVHDWSISRQIVQSVNVPVYLAGGLNSQNVADAVQRVNPFAVDVCSGVRSDGQLDESKLRAFFAELAA